MKQEMMGGSGISWTTCKSFPPRCRQISTPVPHHSLWWARCSSWRPTDSVKALKELCSDHQKCCGATVSNSKVVEMEISATVWAHVTWEELYVFLHSAIRQQR